MELFAQMPVMDSSYFIALLSRFLHIVSAIVLLGGIAYLRKVAISGVSPDGDVGEQLYAGRRKTWAKWVGISTLLLIATGFYNFVLVTRAHEELPSAYHMMFGIKFLLALVLFFFAAILAGKTNAADRFRGKAKTWLTLALILGLVIVGLASTMRSLHQPQVEVIEVEPQEELLAE